MMEIDQKSALETSPIIPPTTYYPDNWYPDIIPTYARAILDEEVKTFLWWKKNALYINVLHNDVC